jgi:hypothetical protein
MFFIRSAEKGVLSAITVVLLNGIPERDAVRDN